MTMSDLDQERELRRARKVLEQHTKPAPPAPETPPTTADYLNAQGEQIRVLAAEVARLRNLPKRVWRPRRTGSAARVNPDRLGFGAAIAALNAVFVIGAMAASFSGQYAIAARTYLPEELWIVVPLALDAPIVVSSFTAAVFRSRKQHGTARWNWAIVGFLTAVSTVVQVTHVLDESGYFRSGALSWPAWLGVGIMGIMPLLVLVLSENLARMLIKPVGERREEPAKPPVKTVAKRR